MNILDPDFFFILVGCKRVEPPEEEPIHWKKNKKGEFEIVNEPLDGGEENQ